MNVSVNGNVVHVTLSERNLTQLLAQRQLPFENSLGADPALHRLCEDGTFLIVSAQTDSEHYERREPGPGFSH